MKNANIIIYSIQKIYFLIITCFDCWTNYLLLACKELGYSFIYLTMCTHSQKTSQLGNSFCFLSCGFFHQKVHWSFFQVDQKFSLNSVILMNSGNLINHWSMNWAQFQDSVSHMCLAGAVVASWSLTEEVAGSSPVNDKYFLSRICWIQWKHLRKTP